MVKVLQYSILDSSCIFVEMFLCSMIVTLTIVREVKGLLVLIPKWHFVNFECYVIIFEL